MIWLACVDGGAVCVPIVAVIASFLLWVLVKLGLREPSVVEPEEGAGGEHVR